jgi:predicted MFS family arabinose efflux permease
LSIPAARVAWVGLIVCMANAALLVLQLVAGRLLAPYIGVSLETWTAVIGVFLTGISLGNFFGGKLADRNASNRVLGGLLIAGAVCTAGMLLPLSALRGVPLGPRIALAALALCLPVSFVLSLITPVAIRALLPDVAHTGRVVGLVYALGTLGSLAGNFLTGFVLIAYLTTTTIVAGCAVALGALGLAACFSGSGSRVSGVGDRGSDLEKNPNVFSETRDPKPESRYPKPEYSRSPPHVPSSSSPVSARWRWRSVRAACSRLWSACRSIVGRALSA